MPQKWIPRQDRNGYERLPDYQGESHEVIDYDNSWENRRVYTDEWGDQTVINHEMGQ